MTKQTREFLGLGALNGPRGAVGLGLPVLGESSHINTLPGISRSQATGWTDSRTNRTASTLKASVYRRRVFAGMVTSDFRILPLLWNVRKIGGRP